MQCGAQADEDGDINHGLVDIEDILNDRVPEYMKPDQDFEYVDSVDILNAEMLKPVKFVEDQETMRKFVTEICSSDLSSKAIVDKLKRKLQKKYHISPDNTNYMYTYRMLLKDGLIERNLQFDEMFKGKAMRETSGVMVITVFTSPTPNGQDFSCKFDCFYCPQEPAHDGNGWVKQPRSYIFNEPGVRRGNRNRFVAVLQLRDRARSYIVNGLPVDKIEILILGGTWHSYPKEYRDEFIRDLFYAANTLWDEDFNGNPRPKLSIEEEHKLNETAKARIIGVTIETRPDQINKREVIELRRLGVTRVQLGMQHTDDAILKKINRKCNTKTFIKALKLLKDNGFKVDIHIMPDLPNSSYEIDFAMFMELLESEDLQADQWKIYPTMLVPFTVILEWYNAGLYKPYAETIVEMEVNGEMRQVNPLLELLIRIKPLIHPWIRVNRVIRDIPDMYMANLHKMYDVKAFSNLRQMIHDIMKQRGTKCRCIRCRESNDKLTNINKAELVVRTYKASGGTEYFLSFENVEEDVLYGFLRLRLSDHAGKEVINKKGATDVVFDELVNSALIRELHVYGSVVKVNTDGQNNVQHHGFGSRLLEHAEHISKEQGFNKISVISGVGVRNYYRKRGYVDGQYFLTKKL
jgi:ELP3 family radical SAM enzyme/protein acetyltransferase